MTKQIKLPLKPTSSDRTTD